jgi:hypothetical protein
MKFIQIGRKKVKFPICEGVILKGTKILEEKLISHTLIQQSLAIQNSIYKNQDCLYMQRSTGRDRSQETIPFIIASESKIN